MTLLHRLASVLSWILRRDRAESRLDDEMLAQGGETLYANGVWASAAVTLAASATTLALIGAVAGWLSAHHASHLDPTQVLHDG
jgi:hypothetical protein